MGTIAQKLEYLNDTRLLLKDNINKINNVLTDNSTFRSYPQELFNGYLDILNNGTDTLWNNLEKVSQTGTEAVLEGVETAPIKMVLNGNASQETTTGKNLISKDIGSVVNGYYGIDVSKLVIGQQYTFSSNTPISILKISNTQSGYNSVAYTPTGTFTEFTFTMARHGQIPDTATQYLFIKLSGINWVTDVSQLNGFNLQIESGSTATSYEEYTGGIPSPSPDYPQEVKVVKGENVVSVSGKNLLNPSVARHNCNVNNDTGIITITTNATDVYIQGAYAYSEANKFLTLPSGNYYLKSTNPNLRITFYGDVASLNTTSQQPQKLNSETNFGGIRIRSNSSLQNVSFGILLSTTDDTYVPYSKTDYPINLGDIELCKINTYKDYFHKDSGKWYVHKEIGKKIFDGTETWNISGTNTADVYRMQTAEIKNYILPPTATSIPVYALCSRFIVKSADDTYKKIEGTSSSSVGNIHIYMEDYNTSTSVNDFKTWLSNNNVTLYYVLATPTETEITNTTLISQLEAIYKAKSVKDKTYITQTNDGLPFILDVEAIKEYEVN